MQIARPPAFGTHVDVPFQVERLRGFRLRRDLEVPRANTVFRTVFQFELITAGSQLKHHFPVEDEVVSPFHKPFASRDDRLTSLVLQVHPSRDGTSRLFVHDPQKQLASRSPVQRLGGSTQTDRH